MTRHLDPMPEAGLVCAPLALTHVMEPVAGQNPYASSALNYGHGQRTINVMSARMAGCGNPADLPTLTMGGAAMPSDAGNSTSQSSAGQGLSNAVVEELCRKIRGLQQTYSPKVAPNSKSGPWALDGRAVASLLKKLSSEDNGERALELFGLLRQLPDDHYLHALCDVFTYTATIFLCAQSKQVEKALELYDEMKRKGIPRNVHTFSALMNVCVKSGQFELALKVYNEMLKEGCVPNRVTYHTLIDAYGKAGQWRQALGVLKQMSLQAVKPDVRTYNTLMIACNGSGQWQEALGLYKQLTAERHVPNTVTYNALITAYSKAGKIDKALEAFETMVVNGCERSVITYSSLISACEKAGHWELALQLFQKMQQEGCVPNVVTYNSLIRACAQGSQWEAAGNLFDQLLRQNCAPDASTFTLISSTYLQAGKCLRSLKALNLMRRHKLVPECGTYASVIDGLWDSGVLSAQCWAVNLCKTARTQGLFHGCVMPPAGGRLEIHLMPLNPGVAMTTLLCWLAEIRSVALDKGGKFLPAHVEIRTGVRRSSLDFGPAVNPASQVPAVAWLQSLGSPFALVSGGNKGASPRLAAPMTDVVGWLLNSPKVLEWLAAFYLLPSLPSPITMSADTCREDEELEAACAAAYGAVHSFEASHPLDIDAMSRVYLQARSDLVQTMMTWSNVLGISLPVLGDGILLMDRYIACRPTERDDEQMMLINMAACVLISLKNCVGPNLEVVKKSEDQVACLLGVPSVYLQTMEMRLRGVLNNDVSAISAHRCLVLYLKRLGWIEALGSSLPRFEQDFSQGALDSLSLLLLEPEFLRFPPSVLATAVLCCQRVQRGLSPFWPAALKSLTANHWDRSAEFTAALHAVASRLLLQAPAPSTPPLMTPAPSLMNASSGSLSPLPSPTSQPMNSPLSLASLSLNSDIQSYIWSLPQASGHTSYPA